MDTTRLIHLLAAILVLKTQAGWREVNVQDGRQVNNTHGDALLTNVKKYCTEM